MPPILLPTALAIAVLALLGLAAWVDLTTRIIPNRICIALAIIGVLARLFFGWHALLESVAVAVIAFAVLAVLHGRGVLGGGDVKLATAILLGLPPSYAQPFIVVTILAGGALAVLHLALRWLPPAPPCPAGGPVLLRVSRVERWRIRRKGSLPYGVAVACGGVWATLSWTMLSFAGG